MSPAIDTCVQLLKSEGATAIYVFGSRARGDARPDSDLDIAVKGIGPERLYRVLGELLEKVEVPVDLVLLDDGSPFSKHVQSKIDRGWAARVA